MPILAAGTAPWVLPIIIIVPILFLVIAIIAWWFGIYNKLVAAKQKVQNQWSQIDVQLKRRYDLIPNLVETVKGYAAHERETLESVVMWRSKAAGSATQDEAIAANQGLSSALGRLMVVVEKYPELKANANFLALQADLKDTENKIAYARQFYNDTVQIYSILRERFPSRIVANRYKSMFPEYKYFELDGAAERVAPKVSF